MPIIGELKRGRKIGKHMDRYCLYKWVLCPDCGGERWTRADKKCEAQRCVRCSNIFKAHKGDTNWRWKGGRRTTLQGYIGVTLDKNDFFYQMMGSVRYVPEHRYIMAKSLGRCLQRWELVHHKNGIKDDNRIENLELVGGLGEHSSAHSKGYRDGYMKGFQDGKDKQIEELRKEIKLVQFQNQQLLRQVIPQAEGAK